MSKNTISDKIHGIHYMDSMSDRNLFLNKINPLAKLIVTIGYILTVVSFDKYDISGLFAMITYLLILSIIGDISIIRGIKQLKSVVIIVCLVGIANPFFDRTEIIKIGNIVITGGMISMATLMLKGVFTVMASYILITTTSIEGICYALRKVHIPKGIVIVILLTYRYIILLLKEVEKMTQSYKLRAPGQKGINIKAWGPFVGQLLLRSMDRAQIVYESMVLRGFNGEFVYSRPEVKKSVSTIYAIMWLVVFLCFRYLPVFELVGKIFVG